MESLMVAINATIPFVVYIGFGYLLRVIGYVDEPFMRRVNTLVFKAFFPVTMFWNMVSLNRDFTPNFKFMLLVFVTIEGLIAILLVIVPKLVKENDKRGVIIQAIYRSNYVLFAAPLTKTLCGDLGSQIAVMMMIIVIPTFNIMAVIVLELFHGGNVDVKSLIKNIITNPLLDGAVLGLICFLMGLKLPGSVASPISSIGGCTTPLALIVLGSTLHFDAIKGNMKYLVPSLGVKMILVPAIVLVIGTLVGLSSIERVVYFEIFATPVATSSYAMAQNMGGDGDLAAQFVVISTVVAIVTLFLWVFGMSSFGML